MKWVCRIHFNVDKASRPRLIQQERLMLPRRTPVERSHEAWRSKTAVGINAEQSFWILPVQAKTENSGAPQTLIGIRPRKSSVVAPHKPKLTCRQQFIGDANESRKREPRVKGKWVGKLFPRVSLVERAKCLFRHMIERRARTHPSKHEQGRILGDDKRKWGEVLRAKLSKRPGYAAVPRAVEIFAYKEVDEAMVIGIEAESGYWLSAGGESVDHIPCFSMVCADEETISGVGHSEPAPSEERIEQYSGRRQEMPRAPAVAATVSPLGRTDQKEIRVAWIGSNRRDGREERCERGFNEFPSVAPIETALQPLRNH